MTIRKGTVRPVFPYDTASKFAQQISNIAELELPFNPQSLKNLRQYANKSAAEIGRSPDGATADQAVSIQGVAGDAGAILTAAEPVAAAHLHRIAAGAAKVPPHVRAQVCLEILKGRGHLVSKASESEGGAGETGILAKLAAALGARIPRPPVVVDAESAPQP